MIFKNGDIFNSSHTYREVSTGYNHSLIQRVGQILILFIMLSVVPNSFHCTQRDAKNFLVSKIANKSSARRPASNSHFAISHWPKWILHLELQAPGGRTYKYLLAEHTRTDRSTKPWDFELW